MKSITLSANTYKRMMIEITIIYNGKSYSILHYETNHHKKFSTEMFYIKKEGNNSMNKITDIEHLNDF